MKLSKIPLLPLSENSSKGFPDTFPIDLKKDGKFHLNCRKALNHTKRNVVKFPNLHTSPKTTNNNININTDRPTLIRFIKEVQREIKLAQTRKKIVSMMKCNSRQEYTTRNKENGQSLRNTSNLNKESKDSSKCMEKVLPPQLSEEVKSVQKDSNSSEKFPKCKVGRVRYRAASKSPISFWEEVNVSEIEIKEDNDEEIATLQRIETELNRC